MSEMERCWFEHGCPRTPLFAWHDGMWTGGKYCAFHAMQKLPTEDDVPAYGTSAGLMPNGTGKLLKTKGDFRAFMRNEDWEVAETADGGEFVEAEAGVPTDE